MSKAYKLHCCCIEAYKFSLIMEGILQLMKALHTPYKTRKRKLITEILLLIP